MSSVLLPSFFFLSFLLSIFIVCFKVGASLRGKCCKHLSGKRKQQHATVSRLETYSFFLLIQSLLIL